MDELKSYKCPCCGAPLKEVKCVGVITMKNFMFYFLLNLLFSAEFLALAVIAFVARMFFNIPMLVVYVLLGLWILIALVTTIVLNLISKKKPDSNLQKNINPYSKMTEEFLSIFKSKK